MGDDVDGGNGWRELFDAVVTHDNELGDVRTVLERWLAEHPRPEYGPS